jgi:hypothetical protein
MFCKDIESKPVHKRTGFLEEGHKYYHEDDAGQYSLPLKIYALISDRIDQGFS